MHESERTRTSVDNPGLSIEEQRLVRMGFNIIKLNTLRENALSAEEDPSIIRHWRFLRYLFINHPDFTQDFPENTEKAAILRSTLEKQSREEALLPEQKVTPTPKEIRDRMKNVYETLQQRIQKGIDEGRYQATTLPNGEKRYKIAISIENNSSLERWAYIEYNPIEKTIVYIFNNRTSDSKDRPKPTRKKQSAHEYLQTLLNPLGTTIIEPNPIQTESFHLFYIHAILRPNGDFEISEREKDSGENIRSEEPTYHSIKTGYFTRKLYAKTNRDTLPIVYSIMEIANLIP